MLKKEGVNGPESHCPSIFPPGICARIPSRLSLLIWGLAQDIYNWSTSPLGRVRVVIIGQDPYHNVGQAHGK